jgi:hypothetical protein
MYNYNHAPTTLGVQSSRENTSGGTPTKQIEYHCSTLPSQTVAGASV